jgi:two-component system, NarL family, nitrate/nitrite response regulator NarL
MSSPIRILLVDDHQIFREGLRRLLEAEADLRVVGEAGTASEAVGLSATLTPDVLLLDLGLPDASGLDVLRALRAENAPTRTVLLTAGADRDQMLAALQLGARGLVLKAAASAVLYRCIRSVMAGEYWFGHDRMRDMVEALRRLSSPAPPSPAESLTRRERQIVAAIVQGATNKDISAQLGLSEQTVKNHISHIFDKVGVSSRLELALFALHHEVSGPDD